MSPANIEAALKGSSPLIGQACVIGDGRSLQHRAARARPRLRRRVAGAHRRRRRARRVQEAIDKANANLSRPEQIKRWTLLSEDWLPGGDELTPTMKLKRRPIDEKYAAEIAAMY